MSEEDANRGALPDLAARFFNWLEARGRYGVPAFAFFVGALLSRAFAPTNFFPVIFICVPLLIMLLARARSWNEAFGRGWWAGFGFFALGLKWIGYSFTQQDQVPEALAPLALFALSAVVSIYIAVSFWVTWRLKVTGVARVFVFAASWTLFEIARGMWFTGFPWQLIGSLWAEWNYAAQGAYWFSVYGLSFLTLVGAGSTALLFEEKSWKNAAGHAAIGGLILPLLFVVGYMRVADQTTTFHLSTSLKLVQANVKQSDKWRSSTLIDDHFDNHMQLSRGEAGKAEGTKLLIWPETAVQRQTFDRDGSLLRWRMSRLLEFGSYVITGAPRYEQKDGETSYYNSVFALNSSGQLYARYDKTHLVPFGEYMPFSSLFRALGLKHLADGAAFSAGTERPVVHLPGVPGFVPLVCYEAIFPGEIFGAGERPQWLLNLSNDAWFGETDGPYQHLALARMRAIEEGLPLVRATSTGISAVIDGYGRTVTSLGLGVRGTLESPLPVALDAPRFPTGVRILTVLFLCAGLVLFYLLRVIRLEKIK